jgi:hypothetical protein
VNELDKWLTEYPGLIEPRIEMIVNGVHGALMAEAERIKRINEEYAELKAKSAKIEAQ